MKIANLNLIRQKMAARGVAYHDNKMIKIFSSETNGHNSKQFLLLRNQLSV